MTPQSSIAQLQQENASLRAELAQLKSRYETRQQSELQNRQTSLLSRIAEVANLLLRASDYTKVLSDVVRMLGEAVGSDRCSIISRQEPSSDSGKALLTLPYCWQKAGIIDCFEATPAMFWEDFGDLWSIFAAGNVANFLVDEQSEPGRSYFKAQGCTSLLGVPIMTLGECWGVIGFDNCGEPQLFNEVEIATLRIAADSIAAAIERQVKENELREAQQALLHTEQTQVVELASVNAVLQTEIIERQRAEQVSRGQTQALVATLNTLAREPVFDHCLGYVLQAIADQFSDRSGGIYLYQEAYGTTILHLNYENGQIQRGQEIQHPCAHTPNPLRHWDDQYMPLLKQGQILIQDVGHYSHNIERGIKQILVVPLLFGDIFLGNITLRSTRYREYQPEELELAQALAYQVTLAVQLTHLAEEAKQTAIVREQEQAAQAKVSELATTNQALKNSIDRLAADPDLNSFLGHVVLEIIQQLNLYTAWVELYDPAAQTLQMHLLVEQETLFLKPNLPNRGVLTKGYPPQANAIWGLLLQTKHLLVITLDTLPQYFTGDETEKQRQWAQQFRIQCWINLPLLLGDEPLGILVLFSRDRTTFSREELELAQALAQQATLAIALTRLAEESRQLAIIRDRNHLAREIHDTLAQGYAGILMQIQAANFLQQQPDEAKLHLDRACALAREGIADARRSVWLLQQDSEAYSDISSILVQLVEQMGTGMKIKPTVSIEGTPRSVKPDLGMHLLRIAQESLNNALRHASASTIAIHLNYAPNSLQITIADDGCGFESAQRTSGFGIKGMRQRAELIGADLQILSQPGKGTQVNLSVSFSHL